MTPQRRLELANYILSSAAAFEADCVTMDEINKQPVTEREKSLAHVINDLYQLIHPATSRCKHPDWEIENHKMYNESKK